jgi:hypothetical protein
MSVPPNDPKLEELVNQPDVQAAGQQLKDSGVTVSSFQDFISQYEPDPTPNMGIANQPEVQAAGQQLRDSGVSTFQDFITDSGSDQTPNMEAAQQQVDRIPPDQQLRNLDVKLDQPEPDNEPDR